MYFGTSADKLTKLGSDLISTYGTTMYYSTNKFIKQDALEPNTTYYYRAYVIVNGKTDPCWGEIKSFKTLPTSEEPSVTSKITFSGIGAEEITQTSVRLSTACSYTGNHPSSVGVYLGTSTNNMTKRGSDTINHNKNPFDIWYDLSGLTAGTTYYYKFYAIVGKSEVVSEMKSFTTASGVDPFSIHISGVNASSITANSVRLDATCSYAGTRPSSVGVYLGTSPSNMTIRGSDENINHNKNPFDIWYNLSGLTAGTTYYYRFYAVVDGTRFLTDIKTFTTSATTTNDGSYLAITDANGYKTGVFDSADIKNGHQLAAFDYGTTVTVYPETRVKSGSYWWVKISCNGTTGYVNENHVKKINLTTLPEAAPYSATVKSQQIAVYNDPMVGFKSVGTLKYGDTVRVIPQKQAYLINSYTWVYIESGNLSGYVNVGLLKKVN